MIESFLNATIGSTREARAAGRGYLAFTAARP